MAALQFGVEVKRPYVQCTVTVSDIVTRRPTAAKTVENTLMV